MPKLAKRVKNRDIKAGQRGGNHIGPNAYLMFGQRGFKNILSTGYLVTKINCERPFGMDGYQYFKEIFMASGILENDFMFSGRGIVPWHGIGAVLDGTLASDEAIKTARLEWHVEQTPVFAAKNWTQAIPGYIANVRSDTNEVLGIVSDRYRVAQNRDVFAFADDLIGTDQAKCAYETAGSLWNGRRVFLLVNMPKGRIVGDEYQPYLCISNAHDGSAPLQVFLTGIRVVCNNTLSAALGAARRKIAIRHMANMDQRKGEALRTMGAASRYFHNLELFASELAGKKVAIGKVLDKLFPVSRDMSKRQLQSNKEVKELIKQILHSKDDLQNFKGTAWGVYNAVADYRSNAEPKRKTVSWADNKMARFLDGDAVMNQAQEIIMELAA
jgi:phage/plasmid-like protein (TIGR03299 family)